MPANVAINSAGVASISEVKNGANRPNNMAPIQASKAAVYWPSRAVPPPARMAFRGPVRQVDTVPTVAVIKEPTPHTEVIVLMGGRWPAAVSTVIPWLFCAARTVTINGTTNSNMACQENAGSWKIGVANVLGISAMSGPSPRPARQRAPTAIATINGGMRLATAGTAVVVKKAAVMEKAITGAVVKALIQSRPN